MRKGNLTREQAIATAGVEAVEKVERENCDFTGRLQTDGDEAVEFAASVSVDDGVLTAYYYQSQEDLDAAGDDLSNIDWEIAGYEVK